MWYVVAALLGMLAGSAGTGLAVVNWYNRVKQQAKAAESQARRAKEATASADAKERELAEISQRLFQERQEFDKKVITHRELEQANRILKRDLQNIDVQVRKLELDGELQRERWKELEARCKELAERYLSESMKAIVLSIGPGNFAACKDRLGEVIARCRAIGFVIAEEQESNLHAELRKEFERVHAAA